MFIKDFCDVRHYEEEVGIEIEVEGEDLPLMIIGWNTESDGSLRGESYEYVLKKPCARDAVSKMLDKVYNAYDNAGTTVYDSPRQSVHIHINVQDLTITQIYTYILTFIVFEELLVDYCGDGRTGNMFCLRSKDAEYFLSMLRSSSNRDGFYSLGSNSLRYSAINVASLFKYGSLEFRSMKGSVKKDQIEDWIKILLSIKDYAMTKDSPKDMVVDFREMSIDEFTSNIFGEYSSLFCIGDYRRSIREGARSIKMIAYSGDWEELSKPIVEKELEGIPHPHPSAPTFDFENSDLASIRNLLEGTFIS